MKLSSSWSIKGQNSILESKPRMESSDWWRVMIKKGLEVIACWLMHGYLFSLCVAEPVLCLLKEEEVGSVLASSVEAFLFFKKGEQPLVEVRRKFESARHRVLRATWANSFLFSFNVFCFVFFCLILSCLESHGKRQTVRFVRKSHRAEKGRECKIKRKSHRCLRVPLYICVVFHESVGIPL